MKRIVIFAALLPVLAGCDQLKDRMGLPDPAKVEAEGKAVGSGCRHAGRGLEDCYKLNPYAEKSAIFAGWKEMNEYMMKNNMQSVPPQAPAAGPGEAMKEPQKAPADKPAETKPDAKAGTKPAGGH
ncbi:MAG: hypothetical protein PHR30_13125 [Gallionellaceae bacterium]|nr:hypothetical protein [Gallionellaceae bacterium]MDD5366274.1 hypothetical protein [Gallionellaceae bacterium]